MPDELRNRLRYPVAFGVFVMWCAAGIAAIVTADVQVFLIASGPFGMVCGYLFGGEILRRAANGNNK